MEIYRRINSGAARVVAIAFLFAFGAGAGGVASAAEQDGNIFGLSEIKDLASGCDGGDTDCLTEKAMEMAEDMAWDKAMGYAADFGRRQWNYFDPDGNGGLSGCRTAEDGNQCYSKRFGAWALNGALNGALRHTEDLGRNIWGEGFRLVGDIDYEGEEEQFTANLDAALPFGFVGQTADSGGKQAFFTQWGITRYEDDHDLMRDDLRVGAVYRRALAATPEADVIGGWAFVQNNVQRGHLRLGMGGDYFTPWGDFFANYFVPLTDWLPGRVGYEERPIAGGEVGVGFDLTPRLAMELAATRWEDEDGAEHFNNSGRIGLSYLLFPSTKVRAAWDGDDDDGSWSANIEFNLPLGEPTRGFPAMKKRQPAAADFFRPIDSDIVGKIQVAERKIEVKDAVGAYGAQVRFMQTQATTGSSIGIEVTVPEAAEGDIDFIVRLVPGEGDNPAVAGEDYTDEPIEITIAAGDTAGQAQVAMLFNSEQTRPRSLSAVLELAE